MSWENIKIKIMYYLFRILIRKNKKLALKYIELKLDVITPEEFNIWVTSEIYGD